MAVEAQLIAREMAKFVTAQATNTTVVAVANPDGSNIFGGSPIGISSLPSINGNVSFGGVVSLASGQYIGIGVNSSLPSINGLVGLTGLVSLASGQYIGIGVNSSLPSIQGSVAVNNLPAVISLASGQFIGLNGVISLASGQTILTKEQNLISLASGQFIGLNPSSNFIGLVSTASINGTVALANGSLPSVQGVVSLQPNSNSGWSKYSFLSLASGPQQVKASQGELGGWYIFNGNATVNYVQFFDIANSSVSLGVRAPDFSLGIPANGAANLEAANGIQFTNAIQVAGTTTPNGQTGPTIPLVVNLWYK